MKRNGNRILALAFAAAVGALATPVAAADRAQWSYTGPTGPARWGKLDKDYATCGTGMLQSPIDIKDKDVRKGDLPPLLFNYKPSPLSIVDDGHTIRVNIAPGSRLTFEGKPYELTAIEFHKPSEEKIDGKAHEMSAHLVHKSADGKIAIVAVLLDPGSEHPLVKTLWSNLPPGKGKDHVVDTVKVNASGLLPPKKDYYRFDGSLTAPPCTENVLWIVLQTPVQISADQAARFAKLYPMNARPTQPMNDRDVQGTVAR